MRKITILMVVLLAAASLTGCSGGGSGEVQVSDEQTKGGNVVTDPNLKEQLTGAANGSGGGAAATSDGPSVTP
jgi:outer membrane protein assembly factor BamE (lipoprotein component of BamABCDE complex)